MAGRSKLIATIFKFLCWQNSNKAMTKHAILLLTCGRIEETRQTWKHNLKEIPAKLYWWDNTSDPDDRYTLLRLSRNYTFHYQRGAGENIGISMPLNRMMDAAFNAGADCVTTMANDILEPAGYLEARSKAVETFPEAGVIAIPIHQQNCNRYPAKEERGIRIEDGHIIGNYTIPRATWAAGIRFCETMGIYGPIDLDFCNQVWAIDKRCIYLSDFEAIHIGTNNPTEYQAAKDASLALAWPVYEQRNRELMNKR
jgi:hypothetical protein